MISNLDGLDQVCVVKGSIIRKKSNKKKYGDPNCPIKMAVTVPTGSGLGSGIAGCFGSWTGPPIRYFLSLDLVLFTIISNYD